LAQVSAVYAFGDDTFCIKQDGSVFATGKSRFDLSSFENIRSVAKHPEGVYGICRGGKVMLGGANPLDWEEAAWAQSLDGVVQIISTFVMGSIVLKENGRVYKMNEGDGYFATLRDVASIVDINDGFAVLRTDGTVRIMPYDRTAPRLTTEADGWQNVVAIFGKYKRLAGLTADGRLLYACTDPAWQKRNGNMGFMAGWQPVSVGNLLINKEWCP
jgi:hypothetical protein